MLKFKQMKKLTILCFLVLVGASKIYSQSEYNPVTTASPFLLIATDARSAGLADMGVATSPDANSLHFNAAKYVFSDQDITLAVNYTPWLRNITDDVFLANIVYAKRIDERSTWSASMSYFSYGSIDFYDVSGTSLGAENPYELALDGSYGLKLSDKFAMAVGLRYIRSDFGLKSDNTDLTSSNNFTVDVSGYYQSDQKSYGNFDGLWRAGFNVSNIGPRVKISDSGAKNFMPTNLKLGTGFDFILNSTSTIAATVEFNKLLVPTAPVMDVETGEIIEGKDNDTGFMSGIFQSFNDAPGGFSEELKEVTWALGAEYRYKDLLAFRTGFFHESDEKGARKFFTLGGGYSFKNTQLDLSYLINTSDVANPIANTVRFSLSFNLGGAFQKVKNAKQ